MWRKPEGTIWISQKTYQHPVEKGGSFYYRLILLTTGIYSCLGMTGELRSCPQDWAREIHNKELSEDSITPLVGVKETAEILGWVNDQGIPNKSKVSEYLKRGKLPEPAQRLASGPVWRKSDIEMLAESLKIDKKHKGD